MHFCDTPIHVISLLIRRSSTKLMTDCHKHEKGNEMKEVFDRYVKFVFLVILDKPY